MGFGRLAKTKSSLQEAHDVRHMCSMTWGQVGERTLSHFFNIAIVMLQMWSSSSDTDNRLGAPCRQDSFRRRTFFRLTPYKRPYLAASLAWAPVCKRCSERTRASKPRADHVLSLTQRT